ncbi:hypothetical protein EAI_15637, partial [Harpegnathos saltator]
EAVAILRAVNTITEENLTKIGIFTDFLSTISTLDSNDPEGKASGIILVVKFALWKAFIKGLDISLFWTSGHKGILGNEIADGLAGLGARSTE